LGLIIVPGLYSKVGGAERWLDLGIFKFQTSELSKIGIVFFLAKALSAPSLSITKSWGGLAFLFFVLSTVTFFLMLQPDFGTTVLIHLIFFAMIFVSGISRKLICIYGLVSVSLFSIAIVSAPYRIKRLIGFLDPWSNVSNEGFQIVQSFLAFKNGDLLGTGLGASKQKLYFLPEAHTDFILSVIGEELGFLGTSLVCLSFIIIAVCSFKIAFNQKSIYNKLLSFGLACILSFQACLNLGVVTGIFPTKGISLPFLSSGISSLITFFFIVFVLWKIEKHSFDQKSQPF